MGKRLLSVILSHLCIFVKIVLFPAPTSRQARGIQNEPPAANHYRPQMAHSVTVSTARYTTLSTATARCMIVVFVSLSLAGSGVARPDAWRA